MVRIANDTDVEMTDSGSTRQRPISILGQGRAMPVTIASAGPQMQPLGRSPSLTEAAADRLREAIIVGDLKPGQSLSEHVLASWLQVSKTPVREALAQLKAEGLVTVAPHRGTFVFVPDPDEIEPISEHRKTLETAVLRLAWERDPQGLVRTLEAVLERMGEAQDRSDKVLYLGHEAEFHEAFFKHGANSYAVDAYRLIAAKIAALRMLLCRPRLRVAKAREEHEGIVAPLRAGDVEEAANRLARHIDWVKRTQAQALAKSEPATNGAGGKTFGWAVVLSTFQEEQMFTLIYDLCQFMI